MIRTVICKGTGVCVAAFAVMLLGALVFSGTAAHAAEDLAPATKGEEEDKKRSFSTGTSFFDDADVSGALYYFVRNRKRYDIDKERYAKNLKHATFQASGEFNSGFIGDIVGVDFGVFYSTDSTNKAAVDHEMNFVPWRDPWHPDWTATRAEDGHSVYKALVKLKGGPFWARAGYFQPVGPGVLGVNWSLLPGTYQGVEAGADIGNLSIAAAWADAYKAPWYADTFRFKKNDGETHVSYVWSLGARYNFDCGVMLEAAYGESKNYLKNAHLKGEYATKAGEGDVKLGYHLYIMDDSDDDPESVNNNFDGTAYQHFAFAGYTIDQWRFRLEGTYTQSAQQSENQRGYFAYRLVSGYGSSNGAFSPWWNARSDWNHDEEKAVFGEISRGLDDILPVKGFRVGVGAAFGWDGKAYDVAEHFREWAFTGDLSYTRQEGPFRGASVSLHYTEYRNASHRGSWDGFQNAFQDEKDMKLLFTVPFNL